MSRLLRRLHTTSSSPSQSSSATAVAAQFLAATQSLPPHTHTQLLDANQLQRLAATLSRTQLSTSLPSVNTPLPPTWHLAYFTPSQLEKDLGRDGTDTSFNPPRPFTRRMWAGGELEWVRGADGTTTNPLRIGQEVTETTELVSAAGKKTRAGEEMVVVGVKKTFENEHGVSLIDRRNWIFRPELLIGDGDWRSAADIAPPKPAQEVPLPEGRYTRDLVQTPVTLFRFSALTFNGHRIHYDRDWCRKVEGHREIVVHGPLNLVSIVDFWRDVLGGGQNDGVEGMIFPRKISYRATSPIYGGERYRIVMDEEDADGGADVRIVDSYGNVGMVGKIER
ncbi:hypothetical protein F5884DRAFT_818336 [Xylogone sp. PMI_703]|nr:hypothetical protein F5884DRAFT_818336 [Xylogone sp. PMI_703]